LQVPASLPLRIVSLGLLGLALLWPIAGDRIEAALTPDRGGCPHAGELPSADRLAEGRAAVLCLLNRERAAHGLPSLVEAAPLEAAAQAHAEDMGRRDFFAHRNPDGDDPDRRIRRAGFEGRTTGENLYWGTRIDATPAQAVDGWMHSPGHRANILRRSFASVGTGIALDAPEPLARNAGVYVNTFGG
jgi:uncharacterized protein YkwD